MLDQPEFRDVGPSWKVAEDYGLVIGPGGVQWVAERAGEWRSYFPLQEPDLFLSFARLASRGKPSARGILRWVKKYGLLRKADKKDTARAQPDPESPDGEYYQAPVPVEQFAAEVLEAHGALKLYTDLSGGGIGALKKRIGTLREDYEKGGTLSEMDRYFVQEWGGEADKAGKNDLSNLQFMATVVLEAYLHNRLEGVRPALWSEYALGWSGDRYAPTQAWQCPDLISAVHLQFYLLMTSSLGLRRCKNPACGMPVPATRRNRWFCNSTCRSNARHYK